MSARFASHEEEKGVKKTGSRKERVPTFPVQTSRSTGRDSVDSAVETHDAAIRHATKKTRFVASALFLLTGTSAFGAGAGAGSRAARTRQRRVGALSREVPDAARGPKDVPTPPPRGSASPRARSPGCENTACIPASIFFVRALRAPARDARRGEAVPGASNGSGASGGGACVATYLAEGLGHVVHGSVGVHDGVLQQTSRGVQRKGRFVVRLGGVVRALRGERPERDPIRVERAAGGDRARGGAAKGEHRAEAWERAPLRARVKMRHDRKNTRPLSRVEQVAKTGNLLGREGTSAPSRTAERHHQSQTRRSVRRTVEIALDTDDPERKKRGRSTKSTPSSVGLKRRWAFVNL